MKATELDDIEFQICHTGKDALHLDLVWKQGQLFLSLKNLLMTDGESWFEISINELENIDIVGEDPLRLRFTFPGMQINVTGESAERLQALRHLLLPYTKKEGTSKLKSLVKFWIMNIRDETVLANLLDLEIEGLRTLILAAEERGFLRNSLPTHVGMALFSKKERELFNTLGVEIDKSA